jgi:F-type H+-transporting ATPase subunit delta
MAANAQLQQFAGNPGRHFRAGVRRDFRRCQDVQLPDAAKNFLRTVIDNGRLGALPEIAAQFRVLKNAQSGSSDATVYSAFPLDGARWPTCRQRWKSASAEAQPPGELEPALIGGVRVVVGDEVLDTSVKARLEQMKVALIS